MEAGEACTRSGGPWWQVPDQGLPTEAWGRSPDDTSPDNGLSFGYEVFVRCFPKEHRLVG